MLGSPFSVKYNLCSIMQTILRSYLIFTIPLMKSVKKSKYNESMVLIIISFAMSCLTLSFEIILFSFYDANDMSND